MECEGNRLETVPFFLCPFLRPTNSPFMGIIMRNVRMGMRSKLKFYFLQKRLLFLLTHCSCKSWKENVQPKPLRKGVDQLL